MKHKIKRIHFVGIGGSGMCGIAQLLHNLNYCVTGSELNANYNTQLLMQEGVKVEFGHHQRNIGDADVVVVSTAISDDNPEVLAAKSNHIPVVPRAMMLAELMRFKYGIAIAGTHGKTTTTSLCAEILAEAGLDPTFIVGGKLGATQSNAKLGCGDYLVAEADESDASFLLLNPMIAVVTNIDLDHMENYHHDEAKLINTFVDFLHRMPFYGRAILCNEDPRVRAILPGIKRSITTYGLNEASDIYAKDIKANHGKMQFILCVKENLIEFPIVLNLPGEHNVLNALAAIAVALECECNLSHIANGLANFHGVARRCQHYRDINLYGKLVDLIDDYAHHPVELKATIVALRQAYPKRRMIIVFQPHRFTRTRDLFDNFVAVLSDVDKLILLEVYSAGEQPISFADSRSLIRGLKAKGMNDAEFASDFDEAQLILQRIVMNDDLVVTMGAGSISSLASMLRGDSCLS